MGHHGRTARSVGGTCGGRPSVSGWKHGSSSAFAGTAGSTTRSSGEVAPEVFEKEGRTAELPTGDALRRYGRRRSALARRRHRGGRAAPATMAPGCTWRRPDGRRR
ncbi:hypothetical protein M6B38_287435 [Iris pallida]|uniref:Uncharacterized protein n=1 Tax=Iris pallida TaxID=29817 RepID=A0AAX6HWW1_IRIPA|nr:hypothetical protein M6B38_287435 [Iris pallida]